MTTIEEYAFNFCSGLSAIYFLGNAPSVTGNWYLNGAESVIAYYYPETADWTAELGGIKTAAAPVISSVSEADGIVTVTAVNSTGSSQRIFIAAYDENNRMLAVNIVLSPSYSVGEYKADFHSIAAINTVKAFMLNGVNAPLCSAASISTTPSHCP